MARNSSPERLAWRIFEYFHLVSERKGQQEIDEAALTKAFAKEGKQSLQAALLWLQEWNLIEHNSLQHTYRLTTKGKGSHWLEHKPT
jgi:hypothetical protein